MLDKRMQELLDWEAETGRGLPCTPQEIIRLEDRGHVVDLVTGEISYYAADTERFSLTVIGEALQVVLHAEDGEHEL